VTVTWLHEVSQSALAAAIVTLGLVILLELRSIKLLRRSMDTHLDRVFEQLDLLRLDKLPIEADSTHSEPLRPPLVITTPVSPPAQIAGNGYAAAAALASAGMRPEEIAKRCGLAAGEAKLLASLAAARSSRRADS
jgi:hypothetical protein